MCESHMAEVFDDMPPSEEDTYVQSTYLGCVRRYTTERKRCGVTRMRGAIPIKRRLI